MDNNGGGSERIRQQWITMVMAMGLDEIAVNEEEEGDGDNYADGGDDGGAGQSSSDIQRDVGL